MTDSKRETIVVDIVKQGAGASQEAPLFVSQPSAGFPAPGDDEVERSLDINDLVVKNPSSTFFVRVSGDSMEGAGIYDNDVLVVDRSITPTNGNIVVAAIFGEMVVKRLKQTSSSSKSGFELMSESEGYEPILVNEEDGCKVWGVVIGSVRIFQ